MRGKSDISLLIDDLKNLKEYEKVKSWKDGARMLMHELKNPLTPLKLSSQSLTLDCKDPQLIGEDIAMILSSVKDIEKILSYFKELVNIEFGPLTMFDLINHIRELIARLQQNTAFPCTLPGESRPFTVFSEPTLVTMVLTNLINNGLTENKTEFYVDITEKNDLMTVRCITPHARIGDPAKIFSLGYSTKGKDRGFGLFLCKKISDYLDLNLQCDQDNGSVVFSFAFKRHGAVCEKSAI
jgi:two-component system, NtrC family, nitrogen regulation sensor histidine kinase NtrY